MGEYSYAKISAVHSNETDKRMNNPGSVEPVLYDSLKAFGNAFRLNAVYYIFY